MRVLAFNGSPRRQGNTSLLLKEMLRGARESGAQVEEILAGEINLKYCRGCLKCNLIKRCRIRSDDWPTLSAKILDADALVFASPIYFHHLTAPLKKILDRFRSFVHVQVTEDGLKHSPWHDWRKDFVLLLSLGSSNRADAQPVIDLFKYMTSILGAENRLRSVIGTRFVVTNQVRMTEQQLRDLYSKLDLPVHLTQRDYQRNRMLLQRCYEIGRELGEGQSGDSLVSMDQRY
ncbi:MAG: flavodoxin family protein [bacterium]